MKKRTMVTLLVLLTAVLLISAGTTSATKRPGSAPVSSASRRALRRRGDRKNTNPVAQIEVLASAGERVNHFRTDLALGGGVDGRSLGEIRPLFTPHNLKMVRSAGLGALTYRLRTELGVDDWHWNPSGHWSRPALREGYWISSPTSTAAINLSYGFRLPRRGDTIDEADNSGYSRLDDGDGETFWKSNPYLDSRYTGEPDTDHPQWVMVDLGKSLPVNSARIDWAVPFARQFRIEYWSGTDDEGENDTGDWLPFPGGIVSRGEGGHEQLRLARRPLRTRFLRLWLIEGSGSAPTGSTDLRDRAGFAIREIAVGLEARDGAFHDLIHRSRDWRHQTVMTVSSTDPWHRDIDKDPTIEQPGFDLVFHSGLTTATLSGGVAGKFPDSAPMMVPVGVLYSTPENAANEIRFLESRRVPIGWVEMGEEPDGQYVSPEDYGALYLEFAHAVHAVDPHLKLAAPSFQDPEMDVTAWPVRPGGASWLARFVAYLKRRRALNDLNLCTLEWYPFDDICESPGPQLRRLPAVTEQMVNRLRRALPPGVPLAITEFGYSAYAGAPEVEMEGAVLNAQVAAQFLSLGGQSAYVYELLPGALERNGECGSWGRDALLISGANEQARYRLATYWAARLLDQDWAVPGGWQDLYRTAVAQFSGQAVSAFALLRQDQRWALLLLNRDEHRPVRVSLRFREQPGSAPCALTGHAELVQYSRTQYHWMPEGQRGHPARDNPPVRSPLSDPSAPVTLPPLSISVVISRAGEDLIQACGSSRAGSRSRRLTNPPRSAAAVPGRRARNGETP